MSAANFSTTSAASGWPSSISRDLRRALLVLHSPRDEVVDVDHARRIFDVARHPKSFVSLDDADHLLTRRHDADYVAAAKCCLGWPLPANQQRRRTRRRAVTPARNDSHLRDISQDIA